MLFDVSCQLEYEVTSASTLLLSVHAQRTSTQNVISERFSVSPPLQFEEFLGEGTANRFIRLETGNAKCISIEYQASVDCEVRLIAAREIAAVSVVDLEGAALPYLFPSRYCQSDKLGRLACDLFGAIENPYERVLAIVEWIHSNVEYVRGSTSSDTSALDTVIQRTGVCRDFAHLGIALCRAVDIPARYFSGYAYELDPPDFHACFECHIGGAWLVFDATRLAHLNGLVRIGTARDAAEASVASVFGSVRCTQVQVHCGIAPKQHFDPVTRQSANCTAVSLEAPALT